MFDIQEEVHQERKYKEYLQSLMNHPNCSDPDHPGCAKCEEED